MMSHRGPERFRRSTDMRITRPSAAQRRVVRAAEENEGIAVSVASLIDLWYVTQTTQAISPATSWRGLERLLEDPESALDPVPIGLEVARAFKAIPRDRIADPWDRLITATAANAVRVVKAMRALPQLIDAGESVRVPKGYLDARKVDIALVPKGWWDRLVFPADRPEGCVDRNAYVFCVLR